MLYFIQTVCIVCMYMYSDNIEALCSVTLQFWNMVQGGQQSNKNFSQGFPGDFLPNFQGSSRGFFAMLTKNMIIKYRSSASNVLHSLLHHT